MASRADRVRFEMEKRYGSMALKSPDMRQMIIKKGRLGMALFRARSRKRTGENARKIRITTKIGGDKMDRWTVDLESYSDHNLPLEFGKVRARGGEYTKKVAERYGRDVYGRATSRTARDAVLGGDNRRRLSVAKTLEEK